MKSLIFSALLVVSTSVMADQWKPVAKSFSNPEAELAALPVCEQPAGPGDKTGKYLLTEDDSVYLLDWRGNAVCRIAE